MANSPYFFRDLTPQRGDAELRAYWQTLADSSSSAEAIYQSPAFFDFLSDTAQPEQTPHLYGAYQSAPERLLGLIVILHQCPQPGQPRWQTPEQLVVLGSAPLLPQAGQPDPAKTPATAPQTSLLHALHAYLLEQFVCAQAIVYRALPAEHRVWQALVQDPGQLLALHLHGWRDCHYMHLPPAYASYLARLGAKRRYNLKRQQRLLSEQAGAALGLHAIEALPQLPALQQALAGCCTPAQRAQLWSASELRALAQHGLLLCYRIDAGSQPCGVVLGLQRSGIYHLFNILPAPRWQALSAGTTLLQLVLGDLCDQRHCQRLEFGYGSPAQAHQSSNQLSRRSHLLLLRRHWRNHLLRLALNCRTHLRGMASHLNFNKSFF